MAADFLVPALAVALLAAGTDRGQAAVKGLWEGATSSPKGGRPSRKTASSKKSTSRKRSKKGAGSAKVGAWAGRQGRKAAAVLGRGARKGGAAVARAGRSAGERVGDKAQERLRIRRLGRPPVWWTSRADREAYAAADANIEGQGPEPTPPNRSPASQNLEDLNRPKPDPVRQAMTQPASKESTVSAAEMEPPETDGQLLEELHAQSEALKGAAQSLQEYASTLQGLRLPSSVTGGIAAAGESVADAAQQVVKAAQAFEAHFEDARQARIVFERDAA